MIVPNITLVISTSNETSHRLHYFDHPCNLVKCTALSNSKKSTVQFPLEQVRVQHKCRSRLAATTPYLLGNLRYLLGFAILQKKLMVDTDWVLLVDDDTTVRLQSAAFVNSFNPSRNYLMADFENMGKSTFACGGGGFLMSRAAFYTVNFSWCSYQHVCKYNPPLVYGDHSFHACMNAHRDIERVDKHACGTCGNRWSEQFTRTALIKASCQFMHNQRSHTPSQYRLEVQRNPPLVLHRSREFSFNHYDT